MRTATGNAKGRHFGTIDRLPSGNYRARYRVNGTMVSAPTTFDTERDAANYLTKVEADMLRGRPVATGAGKGQLSQWLEEWLELPGKSEAAVTRDRQGIRAFSALLPLSLASITPDQVMRAVARRSREVKRSTVARDYSALRACLNMAADVRLIEAPPLPRRIDAALPPEDGREPVPFTDAEIEAVASAISPRFRVLVLTAAILGLRWGEAVGLRRRDIDFAARRVSVGEQVVREHRGTVTLVRRTGRGRTGKTKAATRARPVPQHLLDELDAHLEAHRPGIGPEDLIFVGAQGKPLRRSFERRHFKPATAAAGQPDAVFHDLRHYGVTKMVEGGVPLNELREWFGHKAVAMVLHYTHATRSSADEAAARMDKIWATSSP